MEISNFTLAGLVATSFAAGIIDTIAGGGGMLTLPALLSVGVSPANALATNKLQSIFGTASSSFHFFRQERVDITKSWLVVACTFVGAALGAVVVQLINPTFLSRVVPFLLIAAAIYILFSPSLSDSDARQRVSQLAFALTAGIGIGFYDGFFGPGTGSFFAIAFVTLLGYNATKATANTKVMNLASNCASVLFFILGGKTIWILGLLMGMGQVLGGYVGARLVIAKGAKLVRPCLVATSLAITLKLLVFR
ncbi:hypothetical protein C7B79_01800 [Chroococcidiopsis cubana CCALA 043]|nr:hypothetical protein C7B79_01800 [Chroococcidiopsis cubana CCALA 043]